MALASYVDVGHVLAGERTWGETHVAADDARVKRDSRGRWRTTWKGGVYTSGRRTCEETEMGAGAPLH